jgi:hypothetical protein
MIGVAEKDNLGLLSEEAAWDWFVFQSCPSSQEIAEINGIFEE